MCTSMFQCSPLIRTLVRLGVHPTSVWPHLNKLHLYLKPSPPKTSFLCQVYINFFIQNFIPFLVPQLFPSRFRGIQGKGWLSSLRTLLGFPRTDPQVPCLPLLYRKALESWASPELQKLTQELSIERMWTCSDKKIAVGPGELVTV